MQKKINQKALLLTVTNQSKHPLHRFCNCYSSNDFYNWELGLSNIFQSVSSYDYFRAFVHEGIESVNQKIIHLVKTENPKYVLWPSMSFEIFESTFDTIKKHGSIVIGFFFDDKCRFETFSKFYLPHMDYIFTEAPEKYQEYRVKVNNLINTLSESYCIKHNIKKYIKDVSFIGANIADRSSYISAFKQVGIKVDTYGKGWAEGYIDSKRMMDLFNQSKINLNFTKTYDNSKNSQLKLRVFEICLCGGFLLTEYLPGIEDYFELDKDIVCFQSKEEAIEKIKYYIQNDREREKIANAGWKKAKNNYTFEKIFGTFFSGIEENKQKPSMIKPNDYNINNAALKKRSDWHFTFAYGRYMIGRTDLCVEELNVASRFNPKDYRIKYINLVIRISKYITKRLYQRVISYKYIRNLIVKIAKSPYYLINKLKKTNQ